MVNDADGQLHAVLKRRQASHPDISRRCDNLGPKMPFPSRLLWFVVPMLFGAGLAAQDFRPKPLQLPKEDPPAKTAPGNATTANLNPAQQVTVWRELAGKGDKEAAFQLGITYLIGQAVAQDANAAEQYLKQAEMTPARKCLVAETYIESSLSSRLDAAKRWSLAADSGCGWWELAEWYAGNQLGPDPAKEVEYLKRGVSARDDGYRHLMRSQLGEIVLTKTVAESKPEERITWLGDAARTRLGQAELAIAWSYSKHSDEAASPAAYLEWIGNAARYATPNAMAMLGQAAMARELTGLSFLDGMAFYDMGMRQDIVSSVGEEMQKKQLEPEQREELLDAVAAWQRIADETGGYYAKDDPLRLAAQLDLDSLSKIANVQNPDAELRLAYAYEAKGNLKQAESLYREVWQNGPAQLWFRLGEDTAKAGKWKWAHELYESAAAVGSKPACAALARIDGEGLAGKKDPASAYLWLLRSDIKDATQLSSFKNALTGEQLKSVELSQAEWLLAHREFWKGDFKAAQALVDAHQQSMPVTVKFGSSYGKPAPTPEEWQRKADAGDAEAAYQYAVDLQWGKAGEHPDLALMESYAVKGATTPEKKAHIADGYSRSDLFDEATRRKYGEKWWLAAGVSRGNYELGKLYNGRSDGIVQSDDEKKAVAFWQRAVSGGDERWARLARMELGYRVVKGWSSGNKALDAAWAHELAMEMMGKELYQIAGEYSYGHELAHDPNIFLLLSERAAIYNIDNAQGQVSQAILDGTWKHRDDADAYAWMKLRAIKQDVGDDKGVAVAESNAALRLKIEARYSALLKTRISSGGYYPGDDPLRTADVGELEQRAQQQDPEAQLRLGAQLEQRGTDADLTRAIALYHQIWATAGQEVRLTWGRTLMNGGVGVARDDIGAEKWLWDAANAGSHEACRLLSVIYSEGRGVKADAVTAEVWNELANSSAPRSNDLTAEQRLVVTSKIADWISKHPNW
jgi:TPR repeat protein